MLGCFYLHTDGNLIWKPAACFYNTTPAEYFEGPFVVKWWEIPKEPPAPTLEEQVKWSMDWLREAYELSGFNERTKARIYEICRRQNYPDLIPDAIIEGKKTTVIRTVDDPENGAALGVLQFEEREG